MNTPKSETRAIPVRGAQNLVAGLSLIGLALFAAWAASDLPLGRLGSMGPGMVPYAIIGLIVIFAIGLVANGVMKDGEGVSLPDFSAVIAIAAVGFAALVAGTALRVAGVQQIWGYPPTVFTFCLFYLAVMVWLAVQAVKRPTWLDRSGLRGPIFVIGGLLAFALTVRSVGLVLAGPLLAVISGAASSETKLKELLIFAVAITLVCIAMFKYALKLPMPVLIIPGVIYL